MARVKEAECCLCGASCTVEKDSASSVTHYDYDCKYCGPYVITRPAKIVCDSDPIIRPKAACVSAERHRKTLRKYRIHTRPIDDDDQSEFPTVTLRSLVDEYPKSATELLDRSLLTLSRMVDHPGRTITLSGAPPTVLFSRTANELSYLMGQFYEMGYVVPRDDYRTGWVGEPPLAVVAEALLKNDGFYIRADGWRRIAELSRTSAGGKPQGFVGMWFNEKTEKLYDEGIKLAIEDDCHCNCMRISEKQHINKICDEIIAEIRRSTFVVADFTAGCCPKCDTCDDRDDCEDRVRPRGGVYFEAGFALGLGIPVIWTVQEDQIKCVHFDTRQYNHITYTEPKDLRKQLADRIQANIPLGKADEE